jgi:hypothetical protein
MGHQFEIPGSENWQLFTQATHECWVCDKKIYTFVFWSETHGTHYMIDLTEDEKRAVCERILYNRENNIYMQQNRLTLDPRL